MFRKNLIWRCWGYLIFITVGQVQMVWHIYRRFWFSVSKKLIKIWPDFRRWFRNSNHKPFKNHRTPNWVRVLFTYGTQTEIQDPPISRFFKKTFLHKFASKTRCGSTYIAQNLFNYFLKRKVHSYLVLGTPVLVIQDLHLLTMNLLC
jgi:hypothetical protein